jgi:hypothetical protein
LYLSKKNNFVEQSSDKGKISSQCGKYWEGKYMGETNE